MKPRLFTEHDSVVLCYNPFCNKKKKTFCNNLLQNGLGEHYYKKCCNRARPEDIDS